MKRVYKKDNRPSTLRPEIRTVLRRTAAGFRAIALLGGPPVAERHRAPKMPGRTKR